MRDEDINDLAEKFAQMTRQSKTAAVKRALELAIDQESNQKSLAERVKPIQERASKLGIELDGCDDKALMDELWGDV